MLPAYPKPRNQTGFSLIELLIGMAIAMLAFLAIAALADLVAKQSKTTSSGADAQTTGILSTHVFERDLRMAGYGLRLPADVAPTVGFCEVHLHHETANQNYSFSAAPVLITVGAGTTSDSITIFHANSDSASVSSVSSLSSPSPAVGATSLSLNNNGIGFLAGGLLMVVPTSVAANATGDSRPDCEIRENASVSSNTSPINVQGGAGYSINREGGVVALTSLFNRPPGMRFAYTGASSGGSMVFNLGSRYELSADNQLFCRFGNCPVSRTYSVVSNRLVMTNNFAPPNYAAANTTTIAENVIYFKAQFGKDTDANNIVDTWDATLSTTDISGDATIDNKDARIAQWNNVRAIRFAVVTRSAQQDARAVTASPLTVLPAIPGPPAVAAITLPLSADEQRFRYRVYQTTVQVRNNIWRP